jgi:hypothetical protein
MEKRTNKLTINPKILKLHRKVKDFKIISKLSTKKGYPLTGLQASTFIHHLQNQLRILKKQLQNFEIYMIGFEEHLKFHSQQIANLSKQNGKISEGEQKLVHLTTDQNKPADLQNKLKPRLLRNNLQEYELVLGMMQANNPITNQIHKEEQVKFHLQEHSRLKQCSILNELDEGLQIIDRSKEFLAQTGITKQDSPSMHCQIGTESSPSTNSPSKNRFQTSHNKSKSIIIHNYRHGEGSIKASIVSFLRTNIGIVPEATSVKILKKEDNICSVLLTLDSVENKASILQNCYKLKYQLDKVSIVEDFPKEERNRRKSLVNDLRRKFNDKNICFKGNSLYFRGKRINNELEFERRLDSHSRPKLKTSCIPDVKDYTKKELMVVHDMYNVLSLPKTQPGMSLHSNFEDFGTNCIEWYNV